MTSSHSNQSEQREQQFARIFSQLVEEVASGASLTLTDACHQFPEFESELRQLWGTFVVTRAAGAISLSELDTETKPSFSQIKPPFPFADYEVLEEVGRGGMGIVYRARRKDDDQQVALKLILNIDFATPEVRQRFNQEAQAAAALEHSNIVPIYDIGEFEGMPYFAMKLIDGQTLQELVLSQSVPAERACQLMIKICDAVSYAHQHGILHRDIKPSNVLIGPKEEPWLADFGLARFSCGSLNLTHTGMIIGTPAFMSPEQAASQLSLLNEKTDVYGLGALLYFMLTRHSPFDEGAAAATLMSVIEQDPRAMRDLNPEVPRDLERIVMRCLKKSQSLRYGSAKSLSADLEKHLDNAPVVTAPQRFRLALGTAMGETRHADTLNNWGIIWMWHSFILLFAGITTHINLSYGTGDRYELILWSGKIILWMTVFWQLRRRMGPITSVDRQLAHIWGAVFLMIITINILEASLDLQPSILSPLWSMAFAAAFLIMASVLSGRFYLQAITLTLTSIVMWLYPSSAMLNFGIVASICFFVPGLIHYRRRRSN